MTPRTWGDWLLLVLSGALCQQLGYWLGRYHGHERAAAPRLDPQ